MAKEKPSIKFPPIQRVSDGSTVTAEEAAEVSTGPQFVFYEYGGLRFSIAVDPRAVSSDAEDVVNEIQLEMAEVSDMDLNAIAKASEDGEDAKQIGEGITKNMDRGKFVQLSRIMRRLTLAQADMLAPAILGCSDPAPENTPTLENLKAGGKLAKQQLDALLAWWNPTNAESLAEVIPTDDPKSTD